MKLNISDLVFKGGLVPEDKKAIKDVMLDTFNNCVAEGAASLELPAKPLSFTTLISTLREKGLIKGSGSVSSLPQIPPSNSPSSEEQKLLDSYRNEVNCLEDVLSLLSILIN